MQGEDPELGNATVKARNDSSKLKKQGPRRRHGEGSKTNSEEGDLFQCDDERRGDNVHG